MPLIYRDSSHLESLTPPRTASGHNAPFQVEQNSNVAAMRWHIRLGFHLHSPSHQAVGHWYLLFERLFELRKGIPIRLRMLTHILYG